MKCEMVAALVIAAATPACSKHRADGRGASASTQQPSVPGYWEPSRTADSAQQEEPAPAYPRTCSWQPGQLFGPDYPWNQRVDSAPLDSESAEIISFLAANHTSKQRFRVDGPSEKIDSLSGVTILQADPSTSRESFTQTNDFFRPDCDPAPVPVPNGGALEGQPGYFCATDGDCHLLVVDAANCRLYEMWRANRKSPTDFEGGCQAIWDLSAPYEPSLRGECCTSADAAGLPIAAQVFTADEIAAGEIRHSIRFILPNNLIRRHVYVHPATHSTGATMGPPTAPPYGARLRLKATFDNSALHPAARVVARALQEYGMILSDVGGTTLTAANDRFTKAKWAAVGFGPNDLTSLSWTDFEVVELGKRYSRDDSCSCRRTPIAE